MAARKAIKRIGAFLTSGAFLALAGFALILILVAHGINGISRTVDEQQLTLTKQAIQRCAIQCYVLEGRYPSSIEYMQAHYGLAVDLDRFVIHYEKLGDNLLPEISVFSLEER